MKVKNNIQKEKEFESDQKDPQSYEVGMPDYLDDFIQHSTKPIFVIGNDSNQINTSPKKSIIKKKLRKENNIKCINKENIEKNGIDSKGNKKNKIFKKNNQNLIKKEQNCDNIKDNRDIGKQKTKQNLMKNLELSDNKNSKEKEYYKNNGKTNQKEKTEKYESNQKLNIEKNFFLLYKKIFLNKIKQIFKSIFILIKMKNLINLSGNKIRSVYQGYVFRHNFKFNYIIYKILKIRMDKAQKIASRIKTYYIRKETKKLLEKTENNNIIYSSLNIDKDNKLYFKYIHKSGKPQNFYFDYSSLLKCFIFFLEKNNNKYFKIIEGNFYSSNSNKLIDNSFEINNKGENIINIPKILQKAENINEKHDKIIRIILRRPNKRMTVDEYENIRQKIKDDYNCKRKSKSHKLTKLQDFSRSKSFIKIQGEKLTKSILKPSRSYVNLKCAEKKIQFEKVIKVRTYKNKKDFNSTKKSDKK